jgi:hypothetical protein
MYLCMLVALPFAVRGVAPAPVAAGEESNGGGGGGAEVLRRVGYFELKRKEGELRYPDVAFSGPVFRTKSTLPARWPYPDVDPEGFFRRLHGETDLD